MSIQNIGIALIMLFALNLSAQSSAEDLTGTWKGWDNLIKVYQDDKGLQGIFVDENGEQIQEERVLIDLVYKKGKWEGSSYSKKRNKSTDVKCILLSPRELKVKIDIGLVYLPFTWEKVK